MYHFITLVMHCFDPFFTVLRERDVLIFFGLGISPECSHSFFINLDVPPIAEDTSSAAHLSAPVPSSHRVKPTASHLLPN